MIAWLVSRITMWRGVRAMRKDVRYRRVRELEKYSGCHCGRMVQGSPAGRRRRKFERCNCGKYVAVHGRASVYATERGWHRAVVHEGDNPTRHWSLFPKHE